MTTRGEGRPDLGEPALAGAPGELGPVGQGGHRGAVARGVEHGLQRRPELVGELPEGGRQGLHDLLRGALLQLAQQGASGGHPGGVLEAVDHHPADPGPPQLEQDARVGRGQVGVDQEGQRGEEEPEALDPVGPGLPPSQMRIDYRHVDRLGADGLHGFGPVARGDPVEAVGVESPESENTFGWDGSEEQMSQNGP